MRARPAEGQAAARSRSRRRPRPAAAAAVVLAVVVALAAALPGLATAPAQANPSGWEARGKAIADGVEHVELTRRGPDPAVVNVAHVEPGARVEIRPVLAHDTVSEQDGGADRETTSSMCGRAGGAVCINGDFALCSTCGQPFGGVVSGGRVVRSFRDDHEQLSVVDGLLTAAHQSWTGRVVATFSWPPEAGRPAETETLPIDGLNVNPIPDGAVLYTPEWGQTTPLVGGGHLRLSTAHAVSPGETGATPTGFHSEHEVAIGGDAILSSDGARSGAAAAFWDRWNTSDAPDRRLVIETTVAVPASASVGGHPQLLEAGQRLPLNDADPKVYERHPRTLVGWNEAGDMLLVTVDGRRPGRSVGMTLHEATDLLVELGATDGMNLDGGGSTTFVAACPEGLCVANRPSGGTERPVTVALALIAEGGVVAMSAERPPPPAPAEPAISEPAPPVPASAPVPASPASPPPPDPASAPAPEPAAEPAPSPPPAPPPAPAPVEPDPAPEPEAPPEPVATALPPGPDPDRLAHEVAAALDRARAAGRPSPAPEPLGRDDVPLPPVALAAALVAATSAATVRAGRFIGRAGALRARLGSRS